MSRGTLIRVRVVKRKQAHELTLCKRIAVKIRTRGLSFIGFLLLNKILFSPSLFPVTFENALLVILMEEGAGLD